MADPRTARDADGARTFKRRPGEGGGRLEARRLVVESLANARRGNAAYQVYLLLRGAFVVAPLLFGADKFFNWSVDWPQYLAPWIDDIIPGSGQDFMYAVGAIEIAAGLVVFVAPRAGAPLVAAWLAGIVVNLLTSDPPEYYDIALRDFGLFLAAVALTRLAFEFERRGEVRTGLRWGGGRETPAAAPSRRGP
jgi:hypothetical protein